MTNDEIRMTKECANVEGPKPVVVGVGTARPHFVLADGIFGLRWQSAAATPLWVAAEPGVMTHNLQPHPFPGAPRHPKAVSPLRSATALHRDSENTLNTGRALSFVIS